jgi:hypothetical protein
MATTTSDINIFRGLKTPKTFDKYTLSRGVADFSNMAQWNRYEKGYYFLTVVDIPAFLKILAGQNEQYRNLINTYVRILEYEFRGISGLEDMTSETGEISDGISTVNMINKVVMQSGSTFTMNYSERSGSVLTRVNELFLRGVKDPRTQFKHYNGLIASGQISAEDAGFENEVFKFLYFTTDNTGQLLEKSYYIVSAQPTKAELSIYSGEKGTYEFPELSMEFSGFPITGPTIDDYASSILQHIQSDTIAGDNKMYINSTEYAYKAISSPIADRDTSLKAVASAQSAPLTAKERWSL